MDEEQPKSPILVKFRQSEVLISILELKNNCTCTELSRHMAISTAQLSPIIKELEFYGYIKIVKSEIDRREIKLSLTWPLGVGQAWLIRASMKFISVRDKDAEEIIRFLQSHFGGNKNEVE